MPEGEHITHNILDGWTPTAKPKIFLERDFCGETDKP